MVAEQPDKKRIRIFNTAAEISDLAQRAEYLDGACDGNAELRAEIDDLLRHDVAAGSLLDYPAASFAAAPTIDQLPAEQVGTYIGPYKLVEEIGDGGMGSVFLALQKEPVRRKVALKVIKPGMDSKQVVSRFEGERQALAMMEHPNIARVFDGGTTESGRPFFVMELVDGMPVTEYCDRHRFTTGQRLHLFGQVCQAVQHAHQKGIIHRDLKPSNILVTHVDGRAVPKVIDFGIAKATSGQLTEGTVVTNLSQMIGTPLYMSPEQTELSSHDIDTRSDVYTLGVVLYELLTGTTPFDRERMHEIPYDEVRRIIREEEPQRPSTRLSTLDAALETVADKHRTDPRTLSRQVSGELDWIVMKSLEKDRTRRYGSANELAQDVQRYLDNEPVEACPPSTAYRLKKYVRRHRVRLATIATFAALLVVVTVGVGAFGWDRYQRNAEARRVVDEHVAVARALLPHDYAAAGRHVAQAEERLDAAGSGVGPLQAAVTTVAEEVAAKRHAEETFGRFQELRKRVHAKLYDSTPDTMERVQQDCREALGLYRVFVSEKLHGNSDSDLLGADRQTKLRLAVAELLFIWARMEINKTQGAAGLDNAHRRAIDALKRIDTLYQPVPSLRLWMAASYRALKDDVSAQQAEEQASERPTTALGYFILGEYRFFHDNNLPAALEQYAWALRRDPDHYLSLLASGLSLWALHRWETAEAIFSGAIAVNSDTTLPYVRRAQSANAQGKLDLAQADLDIAQRLNPADFHVYWARSYIVADAGGTDNERLALLDKAIHLCQSPLPHLYWSRGDLYQQSGNQEKAIADFSEVIRLARPRLGSGQHYAAISRDTPEEIIARALLRQSAIYRSMGRIKEATKAWHEAVQFAPTTARAFHNRGITHLEMGQLDKAIANFDEAIRRESGTAGFCAWRGYAHLAAGNLDRSIADFTKTHRLEPTWPGLLWLRSISHWLSGNNEAAMADLNAALEIDPDDAPAYRCRGNVHADMDNWEQALEDYDRSIAIDPSNGLTYCGRANALAAMGRLEEATADVTKAMQTTVSSESKLVLKATSLRDVAKCLAGCREVRLRRPTRAIEFAKKAIELSPMSSDGWITLVWAEYRVGNWQGALDALQAAGESPSFSQTGGMFLRAMVCWQLGQTDEAQHWYRRAVDRMNRAGPRHKGAHRLRTEAEQLLGVFESKD